jgi:hypothetical protein
MMRPRNRTSPQVITVSSETSSNHTCSPSSSRLGSDAICPARIPLYPALFGCLFQPAVVPSLYYKHSHEIPQMVIEALTRNYVRCLLRLILPMLRHEDGDALVNEHRQLVRCGRFISRVQSR